MLEDLSTKIKAQLYDRAGSPLIWAYIASWVSWNFRTVLLLIADGDFDQKIKKVSVLYPTNWDYFFQGICYPLVSSALFIFIYPFLAKIAFWHWHTQHKKVKKIQQKIEDETPATQEEVNALRKASIEREAALQGEISRAYVTIKEHKAREDEVQKVSVDLNQQIASLTTAIVEKNEEIKTSDKKYLALESEFNKLKAESKSIVKNNTKSKIQVIKEKISAPQSHLIKSNDAYKKAFAKAISSEKFAGFSPIEIEMIIQMAISDGGVEPLKLKKLNDHLSKIDYDYYVGNLKSSEFIRYNGSQYVFTDKSRKIIVDESLSDLSKVSVV